jgi:hypothetical protein
MNKCSNCYKVVVYLDTSLQGLIVTSLLFMDHALKIRLRLSLACIKDNKIKTKEDLKTRKYEDQKKT